MAQPVLEAIDVSKSFLGQRKSWAERRPLVQALRGVSLRLEPGQSVGLVGESGSGKSTLARLLLGLEQPSGGTLRLAGRDFDANDQRQRRALWRRVQMVFQDPKSSLNPHKTVRHALLAPLEALTSSSVTSRERRVIELLELVELSPDLLDRLPHELSGGQAQRVAIARALGPNPELVVLDEAVSSLDVSIQAAVLRLLSELRDRLGLAYLFIAHDLAVVEVVCQHVAVMYLGKIVEFGSTRQVLHDPRHPYTRALRAATVSLGRRDPDTELCGEPAGPSEPPSGCAFHPRCPRARERCKKETPELGSGNSDRPCACFFAEGTNRSDDAGHDG